MQDPDKYYTDPLPTEEGEALGTLHTFIGGLVMIVLTPFRIVWMVLKAIGPFLLGVALLAAALLLLRWVGGALYHGLGG